MSDINYGNVLTALNDKIDLPDNTSQADIDFVIESYKSGNSWYRIYKSGWCEQGGYVDDNTDYKVISFLKPFSDTTYTVTTAPYYESGFTPSAFVCAKTSSTVSICGQRWQNASYTGTIPTFYWRAEGYIVTGD